MPARRPTPTLRLRRLAAELRRLRADAGLTREEITERTSINAATLYRIEAARARPQTRTLMALLDLYGVAETHRAELLALSRRSAEQSWLQSFPGELPEPYPTYISFEGEARSLLNYECLFVPGLLQTREYAAAALQRGMPTATRDEIQRLVEARMSRQAILTRDPPLRLWTIVDEAALHRPVGGRDVMRAQLERLAEAAELPHVTLQVVPYDVGGHPGMAGSFVILQFGEPTATDVAYIESQAGDLFLESETDVARFTAIFEHLRALSLPPEASASLITSIARER
ncbi:MAG TPA: helix-turn-helix transcriptional regulator [Streptosporangiaceae bacterium]|nr:helix-turn-helix transcriptional regulator [Streptosporangiaceae bacterium]